MDMFLIPINKTAALVTSKQSADNKYESGYNTDVVWINPKKMRKIKKGAKDLTGQSQGRLTIIGLLAKKNPSWQCKCVCGKYTSRSAKAWRSQAIESYACNCCYRTLKLRVFEFFRLKGRYPSVEEKIKLRMI